MQFYWNSTNVLKPKMAFFRLGGLILDQAVNTLKGFVIFQPIINGIGGNLVSVQASRISTMLHQSTLIGILPPWTKTWVSPWTALFHGGMFYRIIKTLKNDLK